MTEPLVELIPIRSAVKLDAPTDLDVLVRITPPLATTGSRPRPALNLGLVLDRSGSMASEKKLEKARQATIFAVEQLLPSDRVSVTVFDDVVETIVHNQFATDHAAITAKLARIEARGTTALHTAWAEGATQVAGNKLPAGLNRVLLLSDGLANVGLTDPAAITASVRARREEGVSTSTLGVGDDYNERLMQEMAQSGDGNYYFVESAVQIPDLFQTELMGLMATTGKNVRFGLEPQHGVEVSDVLNDLVSAEPGQWRLANLISGMPIEVIVRLKVPPRNGVTELLRVRLAWQAWEDSSHQQIAKILILPSLSAAEWDGLPEEAAVRERALLLTSARYTLRAGEAMERGDVGSTRDFLLASVRVSEMLAPSARKTEEMTNLSQLKADLDAGASSRLTKRARYAHYLHGHSRPNPQPPKPPDPEKPPS